VYIELQKQQQRSAINYHLKTSMCIKQTWNEETKHWCTMS